MFAWSLDNLKGIAVHTLLKSVLLTDCLTVGVTVLFSPFGTLIGQACIKKVVEGMIVEYELSDHNGKPVATDILIVHTPEK